MSVELLHELQHEVRRLFIAGSALAQGDVRLAKLQPQLKKLGEAAPVFNRIAEASDTVMAASREDSAVKLLELATLLSAVLHTQGKTETVGESHSIPAAGIALKTDVTYRRLKPLLEILTTKGQGRLEQLRQAIQDNIYMDLRALPMMCAGLDETFPEIAELIAETIRTGYGEQALPVLYQQINLQGGKGDARRLQLIHRLSGKSGEQIVLDAANNGSVELKVAAIGALGEYQHHEALLLEMSRERRKEVRQAAFDSLASIGSAAALDRLFEAMTSKDRDMAIEPIRRTHSTVLLERVIEQAKNSFADYSRTEGKERSAAIEQLNAELLCLHGSGTVISSRDAYWHRRVTDSSTSSAISDAVYDLLRSLLTSPAFILPETELVQDNAAELLLSLNIEEGNRLLMDLPHERAVNLVSFRFRAACRLLTPSELYDRFSPLLGTPSSPLSKELLRTIAQYIGEDELSIGIDVGAWDARWIHAFIAADALYLVTQFAYQPDAAVETYLISKLDNNSSLNNNSDQRILLALFRVGYQGTPELMLKLLERRFYYYRDENIQQLITYMPSSYIPRIRELAEKSHFARPDEFIAIVDAMEAAPTELIEERGTALWTWVKNKLS